MTILQLMAENKLLDDKGNPMISWASLFRLAGLKDNVHMRRKCGVVKLYASELAGAKANHNRVFILSETETRALKNAITILGQRFGAMALKL